ncbi:unnamed protein product [Rodentolepis nana]|uniref:non-specific serine/threonine protein kinase n=1 Tax=Rodentolepis nana TaxID=102285 RepID=A0A0R3TS61_RODNA|nr:unnamed protein product [Rodentolepis nana]
MDLRIKDCNQQTEYWARAYKMGEPRRPRNVIATLNKLQKCPQIPKILATITGREPIPMNLIVTDCGELAKWGDISGKMTSADIQHYAYQLFIALDACHSQNIIHGTVNTSSLLIDETKKLLKLTEWDDTEEYEDGKVHWTIPNSLYFQSPELLFGVKQYDYGVDLWAAGCVIASTIFKVPYIFDGRTRNQQVSRIARVLGNEQLLEYAEEFQISISKRLRKRIRSFRERGFHTFKTENCEQVATEDAIDLVQKLLVYNHTKRIKAKEALKLPYFSEIQKENYLSTENTNKKCSTEQSIVELIEDASQPDKDSYPKFSNHGRIGSGATGSVYHVKGPENSHNFAVKTFESAERHNLWAELRFLKYLDGCPNTNRCLGYIMGETMRLQCLIFEFIPTHQWGDIFYDLAEEDIAIYVRQMLLALQGCHSRGIMHRDVKPSNMLFDHHRRKVYLTDWGHAAFYKEGAIYNTSVGTPRYCSPEVLLNYPKHTYAIDIWPIGCILASAIFRVRYIIDGITRESDLLLTVKLLGINSLRNFCKKYGIGSSGLSDCEELLDRQRTDWKKLITEANASVATDEAIDLLDKLLVFDPELRLTASEALKHPFLNKFQHSDA